MVSYLSADELEYIHLYVVKRLFESYGGRFGVLRRSALDLAANRPRHTFDGVDLYETLSLKVAAMGESIIRNHPFIDANKRTAVVAAMVMFERNGRTVIAEVHDLYEVAFAVESGEMSVVDLAEWFDYPENVLPVTEEEWDDMAWLFGAQALGGEEE